MNTVGSKYIRLALALAVLAVLIPASTIAAVPVESIGYYRQDRKADHIAVTGVLGYTADCNLALYRNREAAVMRNSVDAVPLPGAKLSVGGDKTSPERLTGSYVIADGKMSEDGMTFHLRESRITYAFGELAGQGPCVAMKSRFVPLSGLLSRGDDFDGQEVWTIGLARVARDGGVVLFLNAESEASDIWTQKMQVLARSNSNQLKSCISGSKPSYVAILGTVLRVAGPGNSRAISRVKSCLPVGKPT